MTNAPTPTVLGLAADIYPQLCKHDPGMSRMTVVQYPDRDDVTFEDRGMPAPDVHEAHGDGITAYCVANLSTGEIVTGIDGADFTLSTATRYLHRATGQGWMPADTTFIAPSWIVDAMIARGDFR